MRKRLLLCMFLMLLFVQLSFSALADNRGLIVCIAEGSKSAYRYHSTPDCPSLSRSKSIGLITLGDAASLGYTPCSRCNPPYPDFDPAATPRPKTGGSGGTGNSRFPVHTPSPVPRQTSTPIPTLAPLPTHVPASIATPMPNMEKSITSSSVRNSTNSQYEQRFVFLELSDKMPYQIIKEVTRVICIFVFEVLLLLSFVGGLFSSPVVFISQIVKSIFPGKPASSKSDLKPRSPESVVSEPRTSAQDIIQKLPEPNKPPNVLTPIPSKLKTLPQNTSSTSSRPGTQSNPKEAISQKRAPSPTFPMPAPSPRPLTEKEKYTHLYAGRTTLECAHAPANCFVGDDGYPAADFGCEKWGTGYTFYMTKKGRAYHLKTCRLANSYDFHPVNAYVAKTGYRWYQGKHYFHPCSYCNPTLPDLAWYERYNEIKRIRQIYNIPEPEKTCGIVQ